MESYQKCILIKHVWTVVQKIVILIELNINNFKWQIAGQIYIIRISINFISFDAHRDLQATTEIPDLGRVVWVHFGTLFGISGSEYQKYLE